MATQKRHYLFLETTYPDEAKVHESLAKLTRRMKQRFLREVLIANQSKLDRLVQRHERKLEDSKQSTPRKPKKKLSESVVSEPVNLDSTPVVEASPFEETEPTIKDESVEGGDFDGIIGAHRT